MIHKDEFRIVAEMLTFTQADLARETELSPQYVSVIFDQFVRANLIERVRVGHSWLYALTERGQRAAAKLPPIDPDEMCLPLTFNGVEPEGGHFFACCDNWSRHGNIPEDIVAGIWCCPHCETRHFAIGDNARWDDLPF